MVDKGKGIADDDYSSDKRKSNDKNKSGNRKHKNANVIIIDVEDSSDDEDYIDDDISKNKSYETRKKDIKREASKKENQSSIDACEINKPKRGRPRQSHPNIPASASSASPASYSASPATHKKGKEKDKGIRTRNSPRVLYNLLKNLTWGQRKDLIEMGFGSLYGMDIEELAGKIGLFVVDNFEQSEMKLKCKNYDILITAELIHKVLGVPIEGVDIKDLVMNREEENSISKRWYKRFPSRNPTPNKVVEFIRQTKVEGIMFKMSILVLFSNILGLARLGGECRPNLIFPYTTEETKIDNIDWCKYVLDCLKKSKEGWKKEDKNSYYPGPLTALILIYIHSTKCDSDLKAYEIHAIQFWSIDDIRRRESFELENGGFGNLDLYV